MWVMPTAPLSPRCGGQALVGEREFAGHQWGVAVQSPIGVQLGSYAVDSQRMTD